MNFKKIILRSILGLGILSITSCEKEVVTVDCENASYNEHVKVILDKSCNVSGCHDGSNDRKPLTNFTEVNATSVGINQRALVDKNMPPSGALSEADMAVLKCWLENGKKE